MSPDRRRFAQRPFVIGPGTARWVARGEAQLSTVLANIAEALGTPLVAIIVGLLFAAVMIYASRQSFKAIDPENAPAGLALAAIALFARLGGALVVLWMYRGIAPEGLKPFALAFAGGFVVLYTVEVVRFAGLHKQRRPAANRQ